MLLSVVIPAYNEINTIETVIARVLEQPYPIEIVIVDDGSTDGTREYLTSLSDSRLRVFLNEANTGKGGALKKAFEEVRGDYCIIQDADLEYDPRDYAALLEFILNDKADVVYGSRFHSRARIFYFHHLLGNKIINFAANIFFNTTFTDLETGYKAFRTEVIKDMAFRSQSFGFEVEFTAHIIKNKRRVYEVPISYFGRTYDEGKKITWKDGLIALYWILYCRFFV